MYLLWALLILTSRPAWAEGTIFNQLKFSENINYEKLDKPVRSDSLDIYDLANIITQTTPINETREEKEAFNRCIGMNKNVERKTCFENVVVNLEKTSPDHGVQIQESVEKACFGVSQLLHPEKCMIGVQEITVIRYNRFNPKSATITFYEILRPSTGVVIKKSAPKRVDLANEVNNSKKYILTSDARVTRDNYGGDWTTKDVIERIEAVRKKNQEIALSTDINPRAVASVSARAAMPLRISSIQDNNPLAPKKSVCEDSNNCNYTVGGNSDVSFNVAK